MGLNSYFFKEYIQKGKRHMKKLLSITNHQGNANQNLIPCRMAIIRKTNDNM